jgi:integrase
VGRKRVNVDPLRPLPKGLYKQRKSYFSRKPTGGTINFGTDYDQACKAYRLHVGDYTLTESMSTAHLLDWYTAAVLPRLDLSPNTKASYRADAELLKRGLGHIPYQAITPPILAQYRKARGEVQHVTKEFSVLSNAFRFAIDEGLATSNPVSGVIKRPVKKRLRMLADAEYTAIYNAASEALSAHPAKMLRRAMRLALYTIQRPADVLRIGLGDVKDGLLFIRQNKTGEPLRITISGDLSAVIAECKNDIELHKSFVHNRDGNQYQVKSMSGMFYKAAQAAEVFDCGLEDLRAKGATDMYQAGADIRAIQALLGHRNEATTWIYIKRFLPTAVAGNDHKLTA